MRRTLRGGIVVGLAALIGLMVVVISPALAQDPVDPDGCTAVPDSGRVFDFTESCDQHDVCYIDKTYGSSADDRSRCDSEFRDAMDASCDAMWPDQAIRRSICKGVAFMYYTGVRLLGGFFWETGDPATPLAN